MVSTFDSAVYQRRKHTPWAKMSLLAFAKEMCFNEHIGNQYGNEVETEVMLKIKPRHDVDTRYWYELTWVSADGEWHTVSAKELDLCLFRAAEIELHNQADEHPQAARRCAPHNHANAPGSARP